MTSKNTPFTLIGSESQGRSDILSWKLALVAVDRDDHL